MDIKGITVRRVLVGPAADIVSEYYLAAVLDRSARRIRVMGSPQGGVEIEQVAETDPEAIVSVLAHPHLGLLDHQARQIAFGMGLGDRLEGSGAHRQGPVHGPHRRMTRTWSRSTPSRWSASRGAAMGR